MIFLLNPFCIHNCVLDAHSFAVELHTFASTLTLTLLHSPYMESDENIVNTGTQSQKVMDMEQFPL